MKPLLLVVALLSLSSFAAAADLPARPAFQNNLMPEPASLQVQPGRFTIDPSFTVAITGNCDDRATSYAQRALTRIESRTGIQLTSALVSDATAARLVISCDEPGPSIPSLDQDESYELTVTAQQVTLKAHQTVGALRGIETFLQLLTADRDGYYLPLVAIKDQPRFRWRGLLIDVSRHFEPVSEIERTLDGMAAVKLNVLHLHLTDDQGFRVESRKYPKLQEMGSDGHYYTQDQIRQIVAYARDRGIRVVAEFDMPGHSISWFVGYPELASGPGPYSIHHKYGILDAAMDPTRKQTYKFLDGFLGEMSKLFPDAYMHIGGDESNGKQWRANPKIEAFMQDHGIKDTPGLQTYFNAQLLKILEKHDKKMVGWDEIFQPDLPRDIVIQSWRGQASLSASARQGYQGILSAGYYLDHISPAGEHYLVDPVPANTDLTPDQASHILGGEACMWAEVVDPETIDSRVWPRTAAIAERLWSPQSVRDVPDMYRRLAAVSIELEEFGLTHLSYRGVMLRRIAGTANIAPLKTLVAALSPETFSGRIRQQHPTPDTPLTRLVDATVPDCPVCLQLPSWVDGFLTDAPNFLQNEAELSRTFKSWRDIKPAADVILANAPILQEAEPRIQQLSSMGQTGLEAIAYLQSGVAPPAGWKDAKLALLDEAAKPSALVRFVWLPYFRRLVIAAAEVDQLKSLPAQQWNDQVKQDAQPPEHGK